ncbi:MAG TPA: DeoR family transcriptional regulator [Dactylosporangium sp.]|jgi:DeoR/GlpR family transcriptional regulator of sugar metabolism|nr:DeoR family transcriptional regulator [Dactylosporangium sp.]
MIQELAAQRRRAILDLVATRQYATIGELRDATGASASTVHRDLAHLAHAGVVQRVRGGVTRAAAPSDEVAELRHRLARLPRVLEAGDLATVERLLTQALHTCERLRRR